MHSGPFQISELKKKKKKSVLFKCIKIYVGKYSLQYFFKLSYDLEKRLQNGLQQLSNDRPVLFPLFFWGGGGGGYWLNLVFQHSAQT